VAPSPEAIVTEPRRDTGRVDPVAVAMRTPHRLLEPLQTA
jgi:hypothetical protein